MEEGASTWAMEERKRERLWQLLERAGTRLLRLRDTSEIYQEALSPLTEVGFRAFLMVLDEEGRALTFAAHNLPGAEALEELAPQPWEPGNNPTLHQVLAEGQAIFVPGPATRLARGVFISPVARALDRVEAVHPDDRAVIAPLYVQHRSWGMLVALHETLAEQDCRPLGLFALQIAASLENARLFREERRRRRLAETLQRVSAALVSTLDRDEVLQLILEQVHEVLPYDSASFMLPEGGTLRVVAGRGYPDWDRVRQIRIQYREAPDFRKVVEGREIVVVPDTHQCATWIFYPSVEYIRAWVCVPVVADSEVKGVLNIDFARPYHPSEEEVEVLKAFAAQAGVALRNAALYQEAARLKEFNERLVQEMREGLALEDADGFFTYVNPALEGIFGRRAAEIVGRHWSEFVAPESLEEASRRSAGRRRGEQDRYTLAVLRPDGSRVPLLVSARPLFQDGEYVGTLSVAADIRERLTYEEQLRAAKAYLESLLDNIPVGVARVRERGEIVYMNPAMERMVGATLEERVGMSVLEFPGVIATGMDQFYRRGLAGEALGPVEVWYRSLAGLERCLRVQGVPIRDAQGRVAEFLALHEDLTEQRLLGERLQESQKMQTLSRVTRQIVHDFNATLALVLGYASSLQMSLALDHPVREDLDAIVQVIRRGRELPSKLLTFAEGGRFQVRLVDCNLLVRDVVRILGRTAQGVEMRTALAPDAWPARGDPGDLQQVLVNLCLNAVEAMPGGGRLLLSTANQVLDAEAAQLRPGCRPGPYLRLSVRDTGQGMSPKVQRRIFEPFFSTRAQGRGLGLSIVYSIVQQHGGFIEVQSEPGAGTTFAVWLPAEPGGLPQEEHPPSLAERTELAGTGELILVVEDELPMRRLLDRQLEAAGYRVISAGDGASARALFDAHRDEIALVVLDLVMPDLDAPTFCAQVGQGQRDVPILISTGRPDLGDTSFEFPGSRVEWLRKPYDMLTLLRKVHSLLKG